MDIKSKLTRKRNTRSQYKTIYIITEGLKTEPNYFNSKKKEVEYGGCVRRRKVSVKIEGTTRNTLGIVNIAIQLIKEKNIDLNIDDCWVVFDKDSFDKHFDNAIKKAEKNLLKVAYSNESFELWLLLHFIFLTSTIDRNLYSKKLTENLKCKYSKNLDIYPLIKDREKTAIKNASKLLQIHKNETSTLEKNPSTTVHLLVESLNELKKN